VLSPDCDLVMGADAVQCRFEAGLGGEPVKMAADVAEGHAGEIVGESVTDDDGRGDHVLPVGGHPVGWHLPAAIAQPVG
jgi:hypothetical protein